MLGHNKLPISGHSYQMTKISGRFLISGQYQDNIEISGIPGTSGQLEPLEYVASCAMRVMNMA